MLMANYCWFFILIIIEDNRLFGKGFLGVNKKLSVVRSEGGVGKN